MRTPLTSFGNDLASNRCWNMTSTNDYLVHCCTLQWRHNGLNGVSNHQPHDCLPNRLFRRRSKKTSKLRVTGLCAGNSPGIGEFPAQMASNAENVSIWWRHHHTHTYIYSIIYCSFRFSRSKYQPVKIQAFYFGFKSIEQVFFSYLVFALCKFINLNGKRTW